MISYSFTISPTGAAHKSAASTAAALHGEAKEGGDGQERAQREGEGGTGALGTRECVPAVEQQQLAAAISDRAGWLEELSEAHERQQSAARGPEAWMEQRGAPTPSS